MVCCYCSSVSPSVVYSRITIIEVNHWNSKCWLFGCCECCCYRNSVFNDQFAAVTLSKLLLLLFSPFLASFLLWVYLVLLWLLSFVFFSILVRKKIQFHLFVLFWTHRHTLTLTHKNAQSQLYSFTHTRTHTTPKKREEKKKHAHTAFFLNFRHKIVWFAPSLSPKNGSLFGLNLYTKIHMRICASACACVCVTTTKAEQKIRQQKRKIVCIYYVW